VLAISYRKCEAKAKWTYSRLTGKVLDFSGEPQRRRTSGQTYSGAKSFSKNSFDSVNQALGEAVDRVRACALALDRVIDDVEPAEDAVKDHPKNGVIYAPRSGDSKHASEAPKTYARRPASVFHVIIHDYFLSSRAEEILHRGTLFCITSDYQRGEIQLPGYGVHQAPDACLVLATKRTISFVISPASPR